MPLLLLLVGLRDPRQMFALCEGNMYVMIIPRHMFKTSSMSHSVTFPSSIIQQVLVK